MSKFRAVVEPTILGPIYRSVRDERMFRQARFADHPLGFKFTGHAAMCAGTFEPEETAVIGALLKQVDLFVDVGANIGYFSCIAASAGKRVVAVEPLESNLRFLFANIMANGWQERIEVFPVGVADSPGIAAFYGSGTGASLQEGWSGATKHFSRSIALSTLDILLSRFESSRLLIKVDVEGAEYRALLGASKILDMVPKAIWLVEITLNEHRGQSANADYLKTFDLFFDRAYRCQSAGEGRPVRREEVVEYARGGPRPDWARSGNYIFCPTMADDIGMNE